MLKENNIMKRAVFCILSIWLILMFNPLNVKGAIVFDNTTTSLGQNNWQFQYLPIVGPGGMWTQYLYSNGEGGDQVTLAGTERRVNQIEIPIGVVLSSGGTVDAQVRFYENDGVGDPPTPGTILWDSGVIYDLPFVGGENIFTFPVPNILVPDTFTWTIYLSLTSLHTIQMGPVWYDPPTIGSSDYFSWINWGESAWRVYHWGDNLGAKITAVPEPSTFLLLGAGLAGVGLFRRKFKK